MGASRDHAPPASGVSHALGLLFTATASLALWTAILAPLIWSHR